MAFGKEWQKVDANLRFHGQKIDKVAERSILGDESPVVRRPDRLHRVDAGHLKDGAFNSPAPCNAGWGSQRGIGEDRGSGHPCIQDLIRCAFQKTERRLAGKTENTDERHATLHLWSA